MNSKVNIISSKEITMPVSTSESLDETPHTSNGPFVFAFRIQKHKTRPFSDNNSIVDRRTSSPTSSVAGMGLTSRAR